MPAPFLYRDLFEKSAPFKSGLVFDHWELIIRNPISHLYPNHIYHTDTYPNHMGNIIILRSFRQVLKPRDLFLKGL
jgi:hypothetical protein